MLPPTSTHKLLVKYMVYMNISQLPVIYDITCYQSPYLYILHLYGHLEAAKIMLHQLTKYKYMLMIMARYSAQTVRAERNRNMLKSYTLWKNSQESQLFGFRCWYLHCSCQYCGLLDYDRNKQVILIAMENVITF